jgi:hypothetical protein
MKYIVSLLPLIALFVIALPLAVLGQPTLDADPVPIDGGASLLVGAAVVYGVKKYKNRKNGSLEPQENTK